MRGPVPAADVAEAAALSPGRWGNGGSVRDPAAPASREPSGARHAAAAIAIATASPPTRITSLCYVAAPYAGSRPSSADRRRDEVLCQSLKLILEGGNRLRQHRAMRSGSGRDEVSPCTGQRELDRFALGFHSTLFGCEQCRVILLDALGFGLLELDVFTLESSGHYLVL